MFITNEINNIFEKEVYMATLIEETEKVDLTTGKITTEQTIIKRVRADEPKYIKLYLNAWCDFKEIKGINIAFLYYLLPAMTYASEHQTIYTNSAMKKNIAKNLGWSEKTATQRASLEIRKLCKAGVLKKIQNGEYQVNPELIGKGDWKDIRKLRATFNLENGEVTHFYENKQQ